jgi:hypothetical protein
MNEQDLSKMLEILEPYFRKKFEKETGLTKTAKILNAIVKNTNSVDKSKIEVYTADSPDVTFVVTNPNLYNTYKKGDSVQLIYYDSLKTAKIFAKN